MSPRKPVDDVDPTPADLEAELAEQMAKPEDERDEARVEELLAELGPPRDPNLPDPEVIEPEPAEIVGDGSFGYNVGDVVAEPGTAWLSTSHVELELDRETGAIVKIHPRG